MGILSAVKAWFAPAPRGTDFYDLAEKLKRVPASELAVALAMLERSGPIGERFAEQLTVARDVSRLCSDDGTLEIRIAAFLDSLVRGVPRAGWRSETVTLAAQPGARPLELWLASPIAGIVEIHGLALDGQPWPKAWSVDPAELEAIRARAPLFVLPTPDEIRAERARAVAAIETWLGEPGSSRASVGS